MVAGFDSGASGLQDTVDVTWISGLGVDYSLGIDGLNVFLILLTTVLWIGGTAFAAFREQERPHLFFLLMLLAETATLGSFLAQDLLLFVLFFDLMLVPFYFLFGAWGSDREGGPTRLGGDAEDDRLHADRLAADAGRGDRHRDHRRRRRPHHLLDRRRCQSSRSATAASAGSSGSSPPPSWSRCRPSSCTAGCPTPTGRRRCRRWRSSPACSPRSAPTASCAIVLPLFPAATVEFQEVILVIALASILYGSVMAFTQTNVRLIAGYSSVAQLGFITAGIFALRADGSDGAILQMVNHGLVVAPLFVIVAILAERTGTEDMREMGGMAMRAPVLAALFLIVTLATLAMPGLGQLHRRVLHPQRPLRLEDRLRLRRDQRRRDVGLLRAAPLPADDAQPQARTGIASREIGWRDGIVLVPLVLCILGLALYPQLILKRTDAVGASRRWRAVTGGGAPKAQLAGASKAPPSSRPESDRTHELPRPPHRLRRALAGHRADRRALRRPAQRRLQAAHARGARR